MRSESRTTHERSIAGLGLLAVLLAIMGCSPKIERVYLLEKRIPPRPDSAEVKLFVKEQPPTCAYEAIGIVSSRKKGAFVSMEKVTSALRQEARKMGGDAVIGVEMGHIETGSVSTNSKTGQVISTKANNPILQGTVIRWLERGCTK